MSEVSREGMQVVLLGELNVKSLLWGGEKNDLRGKYVVEWLEALGMNVLNCGKTPTFTGVENHFFIDVTFATGGLTQTVRRGGGRCRSKKLAVSTTTSISLRRNRIAGADLQRRKARWCLIESVPGMVCEYCMMSTRVDTQVEGCDEDEYLDRARSYPCAQRKFKLVKWENWGIESGIQ